MPFPLTHHPGSQEDVGEIAMALGDHRNAFRRQAGVKGPADKLSGILVRVWSQGTGKRGTTCLQGIYERGEAEEQESLQLVLWNLAATSVCFPIPRLILIA